MKLARFFALAVLGVAWVSAPASAHPMAPALLEVRELAGGRAAVVWKTPRLLPSAVPMDPVLPARCKALEPRATVTTADAVIERWMVDCGGAGLVGLTLGASGLRENAATAILRIALADGRSIRALIGGRKPEFEVPEREAPWAVLRAYVGLGIEHLVFGIDHLLFVLGLLVLLGERRRLLAAITSFTAGHSVTLSLATLGLVAVPPRPIEAGIAVSILLLAVELENRRGGSQSILSRRPWLMALGFGFLHGLGFAGALTEVGLPEGEIPLALFGFNLGIEIAQVGFVLLALSLAAAGRRMRVPVPAWLVRAPAYGIGTLAAYWSIERAAAIWGV